MPGRKLISGALTALLLLGSIARGDAAPRLDHDDALAGELARDAVELFREGRACDAAPLFADVHRRTTHPTPLKNSAKAYDVCGRKEDALAAWRMYRDRANATVEEKAEAEVHVARLEAAIAREPAPPPQPKAQVVALPRVPEPTAPPLVTQSEPETASSSAYPYVLVGIGAGAAIASGILLAVSESMRGRVNDRTAQRDGEDGRITGTTYEAYRSDIASVNRTRGAAFGLMGGAGLFTALGVSWLLLEERP